MVAGQATVRACITAETAGSTVATFCCCIILLALASQCCSAELWAEFIRWSVGLRKKKTFRCKIVEVLNIVEAIWFIG